ncbi:MAG: hypothetical protein ACRCWJ_06505 [Casimicrobium sp.]
MLEHARAAVMPFGVFDEHGQFARTATGFVILGAQQPSIGQHIGALAVGERCVRIVTQRREVRR